MTWRSRSRIFDVAVGVLSLLFGCSASSSNPRGGGTYLVATDGLTAYGHFGEPPELTPLEEWDVRGGSVGVNEEGDGFSITPKFTGSDAISVYTFRRFHADGGATALAETEYVGGMAFGHGLMVDRGSYALREYELAEATPTRVGSIFDLNHRESAVILEFSPEGEWGVLVDNLGALSLLQWSKDERNFLNYPTTKLHNGVVGYPHGASVGRTRAGIATPLGVTLFERSDGALTEVSSVRDLNIESVSLSFDERHAITSHADGGVSVLNFEDGGVGPSQELRFWEQPTFGCDAKGPMLVGVQRGRVVGARVNAAGEILERVDVADAGADLTGGMVYASPCLTE